jgi:predicted nucleotidyltransferase
MVVNARFAEFLADIEPSPTTNANASAAHKGIRLHLQSHDEFSGRWETDFLSGSYARDTAIRPRRSGGSVDQPDVDIIVVTNFTKDDDPADVLATVRKAIEDGYDVERTNRRSVRVVTSQAEMDIVPVIENPYGNGYLIPDRHVGEWHITNPPVHTQWSYDQSTAFDGRFKRLVKLLKWWRRENPTSRRPKGFVLEVLVAKHAPKNEVHFGEAFAQLLESIYGSYKYLADLDMKPRLDDPAVPGNDILSKVTVAQWKEFLEKVRVYAAIARRAQEEENVDESTRQWRRVFGDRFPATVAAARSTSTTATANAVGLGAGYTFPNQPSAPSKPRGFA